MSRRTRTRVQRTVAVVSLAVMGSIAVGAGVADAGEGPVCNDDEAPVCEEPPAEPPRLRLNVVSPTAPGHVSNEIGMGLVIVI